MSITQTAFLFDAYEDIEKIRKSNKLSDQIDLGNWLDAAMVNVGALIDDMNRLNTPAASATGRTVGFFQGDLMLMTLSMQTWAKQHADQLQGIEEKHQ